MAIANQTADNQASDVELRAGTYALLAALLSHPPDQELLNRLRTIEDDDAQKGKDLQRAWLRLKQAADRAEPQALEHEYQILFIGLGRGELIPYGSWYLTGFLMEKPLGDLRNELLELGFERQPDVHEPEDHVAALCDVMSQLIADEPISIQSRFFGNHLAPWVQRFFRDLEQTPAADFYRAVGCLGRSFTEFEARYLAMPV